MRLLLMLFAVLCIAWTITPSASSAQRISSLGSDWTFNVQAPPSESQESSLLGPSRANVGDHRFERMLIGALLLGGFGAWVGSESCHNQPEPVATNGGSECAGATLTVGFVGAVIGGGIGYLLGRATPKYRPMPGQP